MQFDLYDRFVDTTKMNIPDMLEAIAALERGEIAIYHIGAHLQEKDSDTYMLLHKVRYMRSYGDRFVYHVRRIAPRCYEYLVRIAR